MFCILEENIYWKDVGGVLLNFLLKNEVDIMQEFYEGGYGGHLYWNTTTNNILR